MSDEFVYFQTSYRPTVNLLRLFVLSPSCSKWHIHGCSAKTGEGLSEGMEWLVEHMSNQEEKA